LSPAEAQPAFPESEVAKAEPLGGQGDTEFSDDRIYRGSRVYQLLIYPSPLIIGIQMTHLMPNGQLQNFPRHGLTKNPGGRPVRPSRLRFLPGEIITRIDVNFGDITLVGGGYSDFSGIDGILGITIRTSRTSRQIGFFGGNQNQQYEVPPGSEIIAFHGSTTSIIGDPVKPVGMVARIGAWTREVGG
jgi:hypothetical protein